MTDRTILLTMTGRSSAGMARIAHCESYPDHLVISMQMVNHTREVNKFENFSAVKRSYNGLYYLTENCNAMFSCKVVEKKNLGSHMTFIGEVTESKVLSKTPSCTYAHYHKAIKPKF